MDQFNKALSFILGLVVVAVFIIVASGKFNFKGITFFKSKIAATVTPTVTPKPTAKPGVYTISTSQSTNTAQKPDPNYHSYTGSSVPTSIPNTGIPAFLFPLFGTSLLTGIFIRKTGTKKE